MTRNTWNTFVEARYAGLVKVASTVVGTADAADAVLSALLRAATTKSYLNCKIDPFTWVISAVTSVAANSPRGVKTHRALHAVGGVPKPRHALGAARPQAIGSTGGESAGSRLEHQERDRGRANL